LPTARTTRPAYYRLVEDFTPIGPVWRRPRHQAVRPLAAFATGFTLAGIAARYWVGESVPQIIETIASILLFLLIADLVRFWRWRRRAAASEPVRRLP
jgi:hypothetical protein